MRLLRRDIAVDVCFREWLDRVAVDRLGSKLAAGLPT